MVAASHLSQLRMAPFECNPEMHFPKQWVRIGCLSAPRCGTESAPARRTCESLLLGEVAHLPGVSALSAPRQIKSCLIVEAVAPVGNSKPAPVYSYRGKSWRNWNTNRDLATSLRQKRWQVLCPGGKTHPRTPR